MTAFPACLDQRSDAAPDAETQADTTTPDGATPADTTSPDGTSPADTTTPDIEVQADVDAPDDTSGPIPDIEVVNPGAAQIISDFETTTVLPQSVARLSVSTSSELGASLRYRWSVDQPVGSVSRFAPSDEDPTPTFEMNVAGDYTFHVQVLDANAVPDQVLATASLFMRAVPGSDLHITLTWRTPGDPDESDFGGAANYSNGTDVDLHVLRTDRGKTWFDWADDCYWESPVQSWVAGSPEVSVSLDRDDTDGAGPENANLSGLLPATLSVGVHYWSDWGYGKSFATVRIYHRGELIETWADVELFNGDLWHSHTIDGATGVVTRVTAPGSDAPSVTPQYPINPNMPF
jgi:hypothetical protein